VLRILHSLIYLRQLVLHWIHLAYTEWHPVSVVTVETITPKQWLEKGLRRCWAAAHALNLLHWPWIWTFPSDPFIIHRVDAKATAFREESLVPLFLVPSLLNRSSDSLAKLACAKSYDSKLRVQVDLRLPSIDILPTIWWVICLYSIQWNVLNSFFRPCLHRTVYTADPHDFLKRKRDSPEIGGRWTAAGPAGWVALWWGRAWRPTWCWWPVPPAPRPLRRGGMRAAVWPGCWGRPCGAAWRKHVTDAKMFENNFQIPLFKSRSRKMCFKKMRTLCLVLTFTEFLLYL
jgi:hypothetical protein